MLTEVRGLVIRTIDIKETDRLITIFTQEKGAITALARGARSLRSRKMSATMQFCYADFVLYQRGDKFEVREVSLIESFFDIRRSIESLSLANYIAEVLSDVTIEEEDAELLRVSLNSLYAISTGRYAVEKVKAVFEIRCASILGFMPDVLACHSCDERFGNFYFDIMGGLIKRESCHRRDTRTHAEQEDPHESRIIYILSEGAKVALGYAIHAPIEKIFSFNISDEDMRLFARATESYLLNQIGHGFKTLDFYKDVCRK